MGNPRKKVGLNHMGSFVGTHKKRKGVKEIKRETEKERKKRERKEKKKVILFFPFLSIRNWPNGHRTTSELKANTGVRRKT